MKDYISIDVKDKLEDQLKSAVRDQQKVEIEKRELVKMFDKLSKERDTAKSEV